MNSHSSLDYSNESSVVGLAEQMQQVSIVSDSATAMGHASANQHQSHNTTPSVEITKPFPDSHTPDSGSVHSSEAEHMSSYASRAAHNTPPTIEDAQITVRALVSTKEAGVIIGKSGSVIAQLRDSAGVRAGVTHAVSGVTDRVLSVIGHLKNVAAAYELVARTMIDNPVTTVPVPSPSASMSVQESIPQTIIRILIGHNLMGSVIGRQGLKIKSIQDASGARLVATKEMLPQSTERVVEIHGTVDGIRIAIEEIGKCLIQDWDRGVGTVLYNPAARVPTVSSTSNPYVNNLRTAAEFMHSSDTERPASSQGIAGDIGVGGLGSVHRHRSHTVSVPRMGNGGDFLSRSSSSSIPMPNPAIGASFPRPSDSGSMTPTSAAGAGPVAAPGALFAGIRNASSRLRSQSVSVQALGGRVPNVPELVTQEIRIPADMVGCIIGKAGSRITEIRRLSGSRISIAKASESEAGERLFTITGTRENNEKALYLLYGQLEAERDRRLIQQQQQRQLQVAAAAAAAVASSAPGGNGDMGSIVSGHESLMEEH